MTDETICTKRLDTLIRHIKNVQENCLLLGERLIEKGELDFGRTLISHSMLHDNSKFHGVEWMYLHQDIKDSEPEKFKIAAAQHVLNNLHHPEAWGHINEMPRIYIAELVCDITARSQEFGGGVKDWLDEKGIEKYTITKNTKKYKEIIEFLRLLLDKSFTS